ncbi:MAG: PspC domain-containing protein [Prevotella sp.]|jgi:phage shock protein PspC (stress-responsive transcriptional regulator)|nr:PspC domain-containing protein [Prevotella sp.]
MKKVIDASIGGITFSIEEDAYYRLQGYLKRFEDTIPDKAEAKEVMEDVEARVAEIFQKEMKYSNQVVDMKLVQVVIDHLGEIESDNDTEESGSKKSDQSFRNSHGYTPGEKKLYRDSDNKIIGGVCGGLAAYFNIDATLIRILFAFTAFFYGVSFFLYLILWLAIPRTRYVLDKLRMRGYAPTAENIRKFKNEHKQY